MASAGGLRRISARVVRQIRCSYSYETLAGLSTASYRGEIAAFGESSTYPVQTGKPWATVGSLTGQCDQRVSTVGQNKNVRYLSGEVSAGDVNLAGGSSEAVESAEASPKAVEDSVEPAEPFQQLEHNGGEEPDVATVQIHSEDGPSATSTSQRSKADAMKAEAQQLAAGLNVKDLNKTLSELVSRGLNQESKLLFESWMAIPGNEPTVLSYNFMIHAMVRLEDRYGQLMKIVESMKKGGVEPNTLTYNSLLRSTYKERDSIHAEEVMRRMESAGPKAAPDADSFNLVIAACASSRRIGPALLHMQTMLQKGFVPSKSTYNEVLSSCARMRRSRDAIAVLKELQNQSIPPVPSTLGDLLTSASEAEDVDCCLLTTQLMAEKRLSVDQGSLLATLNLAARVGSTALTEQAWALLKGSAKKKRSLPAFHLARIQSYAFAADFVSAFRSVREMEEEWQGSHEADIDDIFSPFTSLQPLVLAVSRGVGVLDSAYYRLADMHAESEVVSLSAINCVIAGCSALRDTDRAQQTFDEVKKTFELAPNVHTYNALMDGYGKKKEPKVVESLMEEMKGKGLTPNFSSHATLANAYIMSQDAVKAHAAMVAMVEAGHVPSRVLLLHLYRRCKRASHSAGAEFAGRTIHEIGYRDANAGEARRVSALHEITGYSQDPRPARRERRPPFPAPRPPGGESQDMQDRWQEDTQIRQFQNW